MLFWKYIFKLLKENVQKVSRPICYCGLIVTYLQVYHEKSQLQLFLLGFWIAERAKSSIKICPHMFKSVHCTWSWETIHHMYQKKFRWTLFNIYLSFVCYAPALLICIQDCVDLVNGVTLTGLTCFR